MILQWFTIALIVFALVYGYCAVNRPIETSQVSISEAFRAAINPSSVRQDYGAYGRDLSEDYKKYKQEQFAAPTAAIPPYTEETPGVAEGTAADPSLKPPSNPAGTHSNNYSLYDINSPGGFFGKP